MRHSWLASMFAAVTSLAALSCIASPTALPRPAEAAAPPFVRGPASTREAVAEVLARLGRVATIGEPVARPPELQPARVLPAIHGWFGPWSWRNLSPGLRERRIGGVRIHVLSPIQPALREILAVTFPDDQPTGLEIFQRRFWREVARIQKEGLEVGFVEFDPDFRVSGVYFSAHRLLAFDVFAGQGTLIHEYRHHLQRKRLDAIRRRRDTRPQALDPACLEEASRFFGELDATTVELPSWKGVFSQLDVTPEWHRAAAADAEDLERFPQARLLGTNLEYPGNAAKWVLDHPACPDELKAAAQAILDGTREAWKEIYSRRVSQLPGDRMYHLNACIQAAEDCRGEEPLPEPRAALCAESRSEIERHRSQVERRKAEIEELLGSETNSRPQMIRSALERLSAPVRRDLCLSAAGFEHYADCGRWLKK